MSKLYLLLPLLVLLAPEARGQEMDLSWMAKPKLAVLPLTSAGCGAPGITITRNASGGVQVGVATFTTCGVDQARVSSDPVGLLVEGPVTGLATYSEDITQWTKAAGVTVTGGYSTCPMFNGARMDLVDSTAGADNVNYHASQTYNFAASNGPYELSIYAAGPGASPTPLWVRGVCGAGVVSACTCGRSDLESCTVAVAGGNCAVPASLTNAGPVRLSVHLDCQDATTSVRWQLSGGEYSVSRGTGCFAGAGAEIRTATEPYVGSYTPALAASTVSRDAGDVVTIPNPSATERTIVGTFQILPQARTNVGYGWAVGSRGLFLQGTAGSPNSAYARTEQNTGLHQRVVYVVTDNAGASKTVTCAADLGRTSNAHEFAFYQPASGTIALTIDGTTPANCATTGTGTGIITTQPDTIRLGYDGTNWLGGAVRGAGVLKHADTTATWRGREVWTPVTPIVANTIDFLGDSITAGGTSGVTTPWPTSLTNTLGATWTGYNWAVSGETSLQGAGRWGAGIRRQGHSVLTIFFGANETGSRTASQIAGTIQGIADAARADGRRVAILSVLPKGLPPAGKSAVDTVAEDTNTLNAAYAAAHPTDTIFVNLIPLLSDGNWDFSNTACAGGPCGAADAIHPTQAGHDVIYAAIYAGGQSASWW